MSEVSNEEEKIDLRQFSPDGLKQLTLDIEAEMARRQEEDSKWILLKAQEMAEHWGVSLEAFLNPVGKEKKEKAPAKYKNPKNPKQTWTGKGRQPTWVKELVAEGATLEEMAIE